MSEEHVALGDTFVFSLIKTQHNAQIETGHCLMAVSHLILTKIMLQILKTMAERLRNKQHLKTSAVKF